MKDRSIAVLGIGENLSDRLAGAHFIACLHIDLAQVTVDRQIVTVTDNDRVVISRNNEHARHLAIEHGTASAPERFRISIPTVIRTDIPVPMLLFAKGSDQSYGDRTQDKANDPLLPAKSSDKRFSAFCHGISAFGVGDTFFADRLRLRLCFRDFLS